MPHNPDFYKGRRRKKNYTIIPLGILAGLIGITIVLFYGMQKYAVIEKDRVTIQLEEAGEDGTVTGAADDDAVTFDAVNASIVFEDPDYSTVEQQVKGTNVPDLRAIFVASDELTTEHLEECASRLSKGNALVLEMKGRDGHPMWHCTAEMIRAYAIPDANQNVDELTTEIASLKENGVYLVAQISCCLDNTLPAYTSTVSLLTDTGAGIRDEDGNYWLDPYNVRLRNYVVEMCQELYDLGFDEVVLADVMHPEVEEGVTLVYTRDMSSPATAVNAVCGFAEYVAEQLSDRSGYLSIYVNSATSLVRTDTTNGQDAELFLKLYDRVWYNTDRYAYTYNYSDIQSVMHTGNTEQRFVPVVINYLPDGNCWVLIDQEDDSD